MDNRNLNKTLYICEDNYCGIINIMDKTKKNHEIVIEFCYSLKMENLNFTVWINQGLT